MLYFRNAHAAEVFRDYFLTRSYSVNKKCSNHKAGHCIATIVPKEYLLCLSFQIDLQDVKAAFEAEYEQSLADFVEGDCSGDYKRLLLAVINHE